MFWFSSYSFSDVMKLESCEAVGVNDRMEDPTGDEPMHGEEAREDLDKVLLLFPGLLGVIKESLSSGGGQDRGRGEALHLGGGQGRGREEAVHSDGGKLTGETVLPRC